jgi:hypothetical protein
MTIFFITQTKFKSQRIITILETMGEASAYPKWKYIISKIKYIYLKDESQDSKIKYAESDCVYKFKGDGKSGFTVRCK